MKITDVTIECYAWPKPKPISNGKYTYRTVVLNLVHVHTDEGISGIGCGGGTAATRPGAVGEALVAHFREALIGEDPFAAATAASGRACGCRRSSAAAACRRTSSAPSTSRSGT